MIVGVAYVENSTPRPRSNRSMDLISPIVPTWTRSSSGSPRLRKRRAQCSTSGRWRATRPSRAARREDAEADVSRKRSKSTAFRSRDATALRDPPDGHESPTTVMSAAASRYAIGQGQARVGGEPDLEVVVVRVRGGLRRQRAEHLPGEALVVRLASARCRYTYRDGQGARRLPKLGLEVAPRDGLGKDQCAGLADGDPEVLDIVDGEVEARRESSGHRPEHGHIGTVGRDAERDVGLLGRRLVHRMPSEALGAGPHPSRAHWPETANITRTEPGSAAAAMAVSARWWACT